ncbi:MAG TPA: cytochrome c [Oceanithermus profundus]|uniref:Cytochrome c n=1 Tax=Oceanithermus profundus TaxID=187137 RepID=A0A7C4VK69_9DEIN|nr:cytochrome c [Oceanithermus profundus]
MEKRTLWVLMLVGALGLAFAADGEALYTRYCQACHQASGEGIPGTYPFIGGPIKNLASLDAGREFVIATTLFGLRGEMTQRGHTYDGVMPGYGQPMSDEEVAALLNWIVEQASWQRRNATTATAQPFTPEEVAEVRARNLTPDQVHELLVKVEALMHETNPAPGRQSP